MKKRPLIIIGTNHHNTLSMVRCFGECGIHPELIIYGCQDSYILSSKYISRYHVAVDAQDAIKHLTEQYGTEDEKAVVIPCSDEIVHLLNKNYTRFKERFHFFNCGADGLVTTFMDKNTQVKYAKAVGISVPSSIDGYAREINPEKVNYPCIIKPLESINGGKMIVVCNNKKELTNALGTFDENIKLLIQDFIKREYEIVLLGVALGNEVYIPGYIHKHRDILGGTTYSTVMPIDDIAPTVVTLCAKLCKSFNYEGLFGIEMIKSGNEFYFIEMNLRNDATTYALATAGVNLPIAYCKYVSGDKFENELNYNVRKINAMVEFNDIIHFIKRKISFKQWNMELKGCECKYFYNKKDIRPYRKKRKEFMISMLKKIIHLI